MPDQIKKNSILVVSGPTASGKTSFAIKLAQKNNGEIINCDSVQLYKFFNTGSAKPSADELAEVPHHLIDYLEPDQEFSAGEYSRVATAKINDLVKQDKLPVVVGGSTLYLKALLYGLTVENTSDASVRKQLASTELAELVKILEELSDEVASHIDQQNPRRLIRAIELLKQGEKPSNIIQNISQTPEARFNAIILIPKVNRSDLYERINQRSKQMLEDGLIAEVEELINKFGRNCPALKSIGYKEVVEFLDGKISSINDLEEEVAKNTRRYAKRQLTYWRNEPKKLGLELISQNQANLKYDFSNLQDSQFYFYQT